MSAPSGKLRFAILSDGDSLPAWAAESVRRGIASGHAELVLRIRQEQPRVAPERPVLLHRLYSQYWLARRATALEPVGLGDFAAVEQLTLPAGGSFAPAHLQRLREQALDFVLHVGSAPVNEELRRVPRLGVWSHRHGEGRGLGFWEVLAGCAKTEARLERLGLDGSPDIPLYRGWFGTCKASWVNSVERVLGGSADFLARTCAERASAPSALEAAPQSASEPPRTGAEPPRAAERTPTNPEMLRCLLQASHHALAKLWELLFHMEVWNVGFTTQSVAEVIRERGLRPDTVKWCPPHAPGHYIADPFALCHEGVEQILVEDYPQGGRGRISRLVPSQHARRVELMVDLEGPFHLSYPCIFTENGETYCVPEAFQSGRATLHRRVHGAWHVEHTLVDGLPIVDPTLFKHEGRYWLLCTLQNDGAWGNLKLYAFHSERLDAEFKPHLLNPIKCDIGSSRPAGSVVSVDGQLYRPSQDCSETYGGALVLHRITKLSPTEFEEIQVARLEPLSSGPYRAGLHTLNSRAEGALIDGKAFVFDPFAWRKNWSRLHEVFR